MDSQSECLWPLHQLPPPDHRLVGLPVERPRPRTLPQVQQALVRNSPEPTAQ